MNNSKRGKKWKRPLALLLTLTLIFSMCSITAFAEGENDGNDDGVEVTENVDTQEEIGLAEVDASTGQDTQAVENKDKEENVAPSNEQPENPDSDSNEDDNTSDTTESETTDTTATEQTSGLLSGLKNSILSGTTSTLAASTPSVTANSSSPFYTGSIITTNYDTLAEAINALSVWKATYTAYQRADAIVSSDTTMNKSIGTITNASGGDYLLTVKGCTFTISDGTVKVKMAVTENGNINISGGTASGAISVDSGTLNIEGGTASGDITVTGGEVNISKGTASGTIDVDNGTVNISGGTVSKVITISGGTVNIKSGASPSGAITIKNGGTLVIDGGTVSGDITVEEGGTVIINGGTVSGNINSKGTVSVGGGKISSTLTVEGGKTDIKDGRTLTLNVNGGVVNITGGTVVNPITANDYTNVKITGGLFGSKPDEKFVQEGYKIFQDSTNNNFYIVVKGYTLTFVADKEYINYTISTTDKDYFTDNDNDMYSVKEGIAVNIVTTELQTDKMYFSGWYTGENGTGEKLSNDTFTVNGDATYYAYVEPYVAKVGETKYTSLADAVYAKQSYNTEEPIVLLANATVEADITLDENLSLNMNGKSITVKNGTLTITGGTYNIGQFFKVNNTNISISGGTFTGDPSEYVENGYYAFSSKNETDNEAPEFTVYKAYTLSFTNMNNVNVSTSDDESPYLICTDKKYIVKDGISVILTASTDVDGQYFVGWYNKSDENAVLLSDNGIFSYIPDRDITISATYVNKNDCIAYYAKNDKYYAGITTAKELFTGLPECTTVYLLKDVTIDSEIETSNKGITYNMGDYAIKVIENGKLSISEGNFDGKIEVSGGQLIITGGTFEDDFKNADSQYVGITGGVFKYRLSKSYCAEGKKFSRETSEDGYYHIENKGTVVVIIDDEDYESFEEAAQYVKEGETIKLVADIEVPADSTIELKKGVTVDLNGKSLTIVAGTYHNTFVVKGDSKLTITGGTFDTKPNASWIADNHAAFSNGDGTYDVKETVTIKIVNAKGDGATETKTFEKNELVIATAVEKYTETDAEYYFVKWIKGEEEAVSTKAKYIFNASEDATYTAVFSQSKDEGSDQSVKTTITASQYDKTSKIKFQESRVVTGYTVKSAGIIYTTKENLRGNEQLKKDVSGVTTKTYTNVSSNGYGILTLNVGTKLDKTIYARSYVTVINNGQEITYYSDVIAVSFNGLAKGKVIAYNTY